MEATGFHIRKCAAKSLAAKQLIDWAQFILKWGAAFAGSLLMGRFRRAPQPPQTAERAVDRRPERAEGQQVDRENSGGPNFSANDKIIGARNVISSTATSEPEAIATLPMAIRRIVDLPKGLVGLKLSQPYTGNGCRAAPIGHNGTYSAAPRPSGIEATHSAGIACESWNSAALLNSAPNKTKARR
jgi:hypothetical protein